MWGEGNLLGLYLGKRAWVHPGKGFNLGNPKNWGAPFLGKVLGVPKGPGKGPFIWFHTFLGPKGIWEFPWAN